MTTQETQMLVVRRLHTQQPQLYEMTETETETDPQLEQRHKVCFFVISYD